MKPVTLEAHRLRMQRVAQHLRAHLDEPINAAALGRLAGLSARQLERVFARTVGESPRAHARRLRLERAAVRLRTSRETVLTVAVEAGFSSHAAFSRLFRRRFGHTPAAWRQLGNSIGAQPRSRALLWHLVAATGLRRFVEQTQLPLPP